MGEGVIVGEDHFTNPGGQTLGALETFLGERTGGIVRIDEVTLVHSVTEMVQLMFNLVPN